METAVEAVRAGIPPAEIKKIFNEAEATKAEEAERCRLQREEEIILKEFREWESEVSEAYLGFYTIMDDLAEPPLKFDFKEYLVEHPFQPERPSSSFKPAPPSPWTIGQIRSLVARKELDI